MFKLHSNKTNSSSKPHQSTPSRISLSTKSKKMSSSLPHHKKLKKSADFQAKRAYDNSKLLAFSGDSTSADPSQPFEYKATGLSYHVLTQDQATDEFIQSKLPIAKAEPDDSDDDGIKNKLTTVHFITKGQIKSLSETDLAKKFPAIDWSVYKPVFKAARFTGKDGDKITLTHKDTKQPVLFVGVDDVIDGVSTDAEDHLNLRSFGDIVHNVTKFVKSNLETTSIHFNIPDLHFTKQYKIIYGAGKGVVQKEDEDDMDEAQLAAKKASDDEKKKNKKVIDNVEPDVESDRVFIDEVVQTTIRHVTTANHVFDKYLTPDSAKEKNFPLSNIFISIPRSLTQSRDAIVKSINVAESEVFARELGNEHSNIATNSYMQQKCEELVAAHPDCLTLRMYQADELKELGYNLIVTVGQGSRAGEEARIAVIEYTPPSLLPSSRPLAIVGKTLTFDTGGHCLKPGSCMLEMWQDKLGGVHTLSIMRALALNKPQTGKKIIGALAIAENAIGSRAVHPNAIITDGNGLTTEIIDTDAEGRMALASALAVVQQHHGAKDLITTATLTGSVMVALGTFAAGIFTNDPSKASQLIQTGLSHDELYWQLPIFPQHHKTIKGGLHTDLIQCSTGRLSDASNAAAFLETFIKPKATFMHLDIAGVAALDAETGSKPAGATGTGITSLYDFITRQ